MERLGSILTNSYLVYTVVLLIIFGASGDLNQNIIKYVSVASLLSYAAISMYNKSMSKKQLENNDLSNFFISGESEKIEYITVTCIYLSAIYFVLKLTVL
ncbi:hypothetical protein DZA35_01530 [Arcobacter sp. HD9-500m-PIT-SAG03]|nr:hypothetical protein DZA35_01530 [Arcobacter sp. HD9-500m-PIT-SAG03]